MGRYQDQLGTHGALRYMAERINIDVRSPQACFMRATPLGAMISGPELVDLDELNYTGSWGWFHELGHEAHADQTRAGNNNAYTFHDQWRLRSIFWCMPMTVWGSGSKEGGIGPVTISVMKQALEGLQVAIPISGCNTSWPFLQLRDHLGWAAFEEVFLIITKIRCFRLAMRRNAINRHSGSPMWWATILLPFSEMSGVRYLRRQWPLKQRRFPHAGVGWGDRSRTCPWDLISIQRAKRSP